MFNQPAAGRAALIRAAAHASPEAAEAARMFQRTLGSWVLDCARLRRRGLDRPRLAGPAAEPAGAARWAHFRGA